MIDGKLILSINGKLKLFTANKNLHILKKIEGICTEYKNGTFTDKPYHFYTKNDEHKEGTTNQD